MALEQLAAPTFYAAPIQVAKNRAFLIRAFKFHLAKTPRPRKMRLIYEIPVKNGP
jgi:hypothetical protein